MADRKASGFSLLELLVSMSVFAILLVVMSLMVSRTGSIWSYTRGKIEQFRESREAFDGLTRRLAEATLNTYWDYEDSTGASRNSSTSLTFVPASYSRKSELRFISGPGLAGTSHAVFFQAPTGRSRNGNTGSYALNTVGYYTELGDDSRFLPDFIKPRKRFRLMELAEPTEELRVYGYTSGNATPEQQLSRGWFTDALAQTPPPVQIAGENIIALILLPMLPSGDRAAGSYTEASLAPDYLYDSTARNADPNLNPRHQLPPLVRVTVLAIDETSANRLGDAGQEEIRVFLAGKFQSALLYDTQLRETEQWLAGRSIIYRVFTTSVNLRNAKWSREQRE